MNVYGFRIFLVTGSSIYVRTYGLSSIECLKTISFNGFQSGHILIEPPSDIGWEHLAPGAVIGNRKGEETFIPYDKVVYILGTGQEK